jgi:crotonobetainyl-CoA:carnitine CoA-transferase CaiB-like acyl-CoA transferase
MIVEVNGLKQFAPPFKLSEFRFEARSSPPEQGADSEAILREAGFGPDEIDRLRMQRVI